MAGSSPAMTTEAQRRRCPSRGARRLPPQRRLRRDEAAQRHDSIGWLRGERKCASAPVVSCKSADASFMIIIAKSRGDVMAETRKIAAILVADVVGYSRLAGLDEEGTLAQLRSLRSDLIDPVVALHQGGSSSAPATDSSRVSQHRRCCPLCDRTPERHGRAQRWPAGTSPHRVPHRRPSRRCRRGGGRRSDGRGSQRRRTARGSRRPWRRLPLRGRLGVRCATSSRSPSSTWARRR